MRRKLLIALLVSVAAWALAMTLLSYLSTKPTTLGAADGQFAPCPNKPNCVCSQSTDEHAIEPLRAQGDPDAAWKRLGEVLATWPRTRVVTMTDSYLHAECTSALFRFVDDLECVLDRGAGVIHVRSASRAGHSDLGVNRRRVELLRRALADPAPPPQD